MSVRVKILTTMIFPRGSVNPEALVWKRIEIVQLGSLNNFIVDRIEYCAETPGQVDICICPDVPPKPEPETPSPRLKGKP